MKAMRRSTVVKVPAGRYFLGDPCYAVPDEKWIPLLNSCETFNEPIGQVDGIQVLAFSTAYGDGTYTDDKRNEYPVDAGLIGLTPVDLCGESVTGGLYVEFRTPVECRDDDGVLHFGSIRIDTKQEEDGAD